MQSSEGVFTVDLIQRKATLTDITQLKTFILLPLKFRSAESLNSKCRTLLRIFEFWALGDGSGAQ